MAVQVVGRPDALELAALLAVLTGRRDAAPPALVRWQETRRAALRDRHGR